MTRREYQAGRPTTLVSAITSSETSFVITDNTNWPDGADYDFWVTIDGGTAQEERILCSARSGSTVTVATGGRGKDGTTASAHAASASVWPSWSATDADEANEHINLTTGVHGYTANAAEINILDGATLSTAELNILDGVTASTAEINILDCATITTTELNYLDGVTSSIQTQFNALDVFPKGMITPFGGSSAPTGWLMCNGDTVSRTTYSALFNVIGETYGSGDGSTTFKLPDLRGRAPIGSGTGSGLTARSLGASLGAETLPLHKHTINHGHSASGSTSITGGDHAHNVHTAWSGANTHDHAGGTDNYVGAAPDPTQGYDENNDAAASRGHSHDASTSVSVTDYTGYSGETGTGTHGVMQPSTVVNFIIKH